MEKDYEIIQNISLAEKKEQEAPKANEEPVVTVNPPGEVPASPAIEVPEVVVQPPGEEVTVSEPEVKLEVPGIVLPEEPTVVQETPVVETAPIVAEEPTVVQPTYEETAVQAEESTPEYSYGDNTENNDYTSMYNSIESSKYNNYNSSYSDSPAYVSDASSVLDIDYKDEDSINRYYDQKIQNYINETEKERASALDQCKRYNEMSTWVNEIGSSFNFFKGRSGY